MTDQPPYLCWATHHEDLTAQVQAVCAELRSGQGMPSFSMLRARSETEQAVTVTCSSGHDNVFTIEIA